MVGLLSHRTQGQTTEMGTLSTILFAGAVFTLTREGESTTDSLIGTEVGWSNGGTSEALSPPSSMISSSSGSKEGTLSTSEESITASILLEVLQPVQVVPVLRRPQHN